MNSKTILIVAIAAVLGYYFFIRNKTTGKKDENEIDSNNPPDKPPGNEPTNGPENPQPGDPDWPVDRNGDPYPQDPDTGEPVTPEGEGEASKVAPASRGEPPKVVVAADGKIHFSAPKIAASKGGGSGVTPDRKDINWKQYGFSAPKANESIKKFKGNSNTDNSAWLKVEYYTKNVVTKRDIFPDDGKPHFGAPQKAK